MRIILDTDNEQNFVDLWNPEKNNWERYIKCEKKEETKPTTRESIEALGYACGEIQKCFTNNWGKSLKNKSLNEEDKKIEKIDMFDYFTGYDFGGTNDDLLKHLERNFNIINNTLNEIIDYINGGTNGE